MDNIAVVILNWNGLEFLKKFLGGVVRNTKISGSSVWVVDNGSNDGSAEWVSDNFTSVKVIRFEENLGYAGGYARALEIIDARYFVLLNTDVEVSEGWLEPMYNLMEENPVVAACQPKILSQTERNRFEYAGAAGGYLDKHGYPFCRGRIMHFTETDNGQYESPVRVMWASGACLMVRNEAYRQAGGLDSTFFAHMEEIDLCWRLYHHGNECWSVPSSVVYHVGGGTLKYDSPGKTHLNFRNNLFMLYKNLPAKGFRRILLFRKVLDGVAAIMFLLRGKPRHFAAVISAHKDYYRARTRRIAERKRIAAATGQQALPCHLMLNKSILYLFYIRGLRKFSDISF
ncbi:MAG: glycosyltransferase family 2 protein [Bacteroidales bacterium]